MVPGEKPLDLLGQPAESLGGLGAILSAERTKSLAQGEREAREHGDLRAERLGRRDGGLEAAVRQQGPLDLPADL